MRYLPFHGLVLLIGNSITGGYGPKVPDGLKGKVSVARLTTSKSLGDPALPAEVAMMFELVGKAVQGLLVIGDCV
jgi:hypothetical protein